MRHPVFSSLRLASLDHASLRSTLLWRLYRRKPQNDARLSSFSFLALPSSPNMGLFYRLSLLAILLTTFAIVHAYERKSLGRPQRVGRFNSKASITRSNVKLNLTEAEAHARWLTSRKPTRRSESRRSLSKARS